MIYRLFIATVLLSSVGCNVARNNRPNEPKVATKPTNREIVLTDSAVTVIPTDQPAATKSPRFEYGELRWEIGGAVRRVTLERPGDQFKGEYFRDALDYATLPRPMPTNTELATSSDLLTMLSTEGWEVVAHSMADPNPTMHVEVWTIRRVAPAK